MSSMARRTATQKTRPSAAGTKPKDTEIPIADTNDTPAQEPEKAPSIGEMETDPEAGNQESSSLSEFTRETLAMLKEEWKKETEEFGRKLLAPLKLELDDLSRRIDALEADSLLDAFERDVLGIEDCDEDGPDKDAITPQEQ